MVCNIGHFDNEIDTKYMRDNWQWEVVKPQVHKIYRADPEKNPENYLLLLSEGRLVNLGCATGHPSFVMSSSFANQTLAQLDLWEKRGSNKPGVYVLPKVLDEEVARLHLAKLGVQLTQLTEEQADYIGVAVEGPYKPEHYRY